MANKIGIFAYGAHGDIALCTSVLKYKDRLWPGKEIVWYCNLTTETSPYSDMLKFNDAISEIRDWPSKNGAGVDFREIKNEIGQLRLEKRNEFENLKDLHNGYFPAPWAMLPDKQFDNTLYANIPRIVCGADPSWEWHPYLCFSDQERTNAKDFCYSLPHSKTIMLETQLRSAGNYNLNEEITKKIMRMCRDKFGKCNFIFASLTDNSKYIDDTGVVLAHQFTVRQLALVYNYCDLFIGVNSGITMASSCWGNKPVPRIELCGPTSASSIIANGPFIPVWCQDIPIPETNRRLEHAVRETLKKF